MTLVTASIAKACQPPACTTAPVVLGADPPEGGAWLGLIISALLPILLIGAFLFFMLRQAQGTNNQAMSFGKSRARMFLGNKTVVTFGDVAGVVVACCISATVLRTATEAVRRSDRGSVSETASSVERPSGVL
jgi:preprotein translocase subunit YajC